MRKHASIDDEPADAPQVQWLALRDQRQVAAMHAVAMPLALEGSAQWVNTPQRLDFISRRFDLLFLYRSRVSNFTADYIFARAPWAAGDSHHFARFT